MPCHSSLAYLLKKFSDIIQSENATLVLRTPLPSPSCLTCMFSSSIYDEAMHDMYMYKGFKLYIFTFTKRNPLNCYYKNTNGIVSAKRGLAHTIIKFPVRAIEV